LPLHVFCSGPLIIRQVCTKVAGYLEQGQRLENLSWRLWHLQNLIVDTGDAKSKREFKRLSKCMGDKLDKEKGRFVTPLALVKVLSAHAIRMESGASKSSRRLVSNATILRI
jgi:hypothetical protein